MMEPIEAFGESNLVTAAVSGWKWVVAIVGLVAMAREDLIIITEAM
jgi:hypothetical protein